MNNARPICPYSPKHCRWIASWLTDPAQGMVQVCHRLTHSYTMTPGIDPLGGAIAVAQGDHQRWVANQITQHQHLPSVNANGSTSRSPKVPLMCRLLNKRHLLAEKGRGWVLPLNHSTVLGVHIPQVTSRTHRHRPTRFLPQRCLFLGVLLFKQGNPCEGRCSWRV